MDDKKKTTTHSLIPPEGDKNAGPAIFMLLEKVIKDKEDIGLHAKIKRNHELRMGEHWRNQDKKVPFVVANLIFNHMQKNCNLLTDNNPVFNVAKVGEISSEQEENIELIQRTAEHWWNEQEQQAVFEDTVLNGEEYGIAIEHTKFNRELEWGIGEVETLNIDPLYFGFYPTKLKSPRDLNTAEALFYYYPMSVREIKRRWPKAGKDVKPDEEISKNLDDDRREISQKKDSESKFFGALITVADSIKQMLSFKFGDDGGEEETLVCDCWCKDYTMVPEGKDKERPKYPGFIRRIIACNGGKVVLADDPNPSINPNLDFEKARNCYLFDKYPFYARNSVRDTSNAWGFSDMEQLERLNMEFNKCLSQLVLTKDRKARAKIINPMTSGVENSEFTNIAGVIRPSNTIEAAGIRYLTFDGDTRDFTESLNLFKEIFYTIAGTFELENAQAPGKSVIAYKAIAALIEQASTMRKGKIRAYSAMIRERGRCYISLAQNWYTDTDRWITYQKDGVSETQPITNIDLLVPAKLTVVTGSTMPVSKVQQREEAIALYRQNAIDLEKLHETLDTSGRAAMLKRMKQGPFGSQGERLAELQVPPQLVEYISTIGLLDDKTFKKGMDKGDFPPFPQVMQEMQQEMEGKEPPPDPMQEVEMREKEAKIMESEAKVAKTEAELEKAQAESKKIDVEIDLIREKIETEKIDRLVKLEGVEFDKDKLKIERAKVVGDMASSLEPDKGKQSEAKMGHTEKGLKSNNENK